MKILCKIDNAVSEKKGYSKTLNLFSSFQVNGTFPKKVIFYRDGVGEGQLEEVKETEIKAIKKVMATLNESGTADIKLTFIIVSKRINTRFFTETSPSQNPPSGTVVDDVATLPER